jgi:hypothetical protein
VVSGEGEHRNAADATLDFLGNCERIHSLRLHSHAEANEKTTNGTEMKRPTEGGLTKDESHGMA